MKSNKIKYLINIMIINFIKGFIATPAGFITAKLTSSAVDLAIKGSTSKLLQLIIGFVAFIIVYRIICYILDIISGKMSANSKQKYKMNVYKCFLSQPPWIISKLGAARAVSSFFTDVDTLTEFYINKLPNIFNALILASAYTIYLMIKNMPVAATLLAIGAIQLIPPVIVKKFLVQNYDNCQDIEAKITECIVSGYKGMSTIKLFDIKKWFLKKYMKIQKRYIKIGNKSSATFAFQIIMQKGVSYILQFGTYAIMGWYILIHILSIDTGLQAIVLSNKLYSAIKNIFDTIPEFAVAKKAEQRINALTAPVKTNYSNFKLNYKEPVYDIKNLCFSYDQNPVLDNIDLEIMPNDIVIITGANGQGKSTLLNILLGILNGYSGTVNFYGTDLKSISPEDYYKYIAAVSQQESGFLVSPYEFFKAHEMSGQFTLHDALNTSYDLGLSNEIINNDKLIDMSGGEFKKVYLTAGLLKKSNVLFLDEPGNCLDIQAKKVLKEKIKNCGKTVIMITHDPYFMDIATLKVVVCNGKLTEERNIEYEKTCNI